MALSTEFSLRLPNSPGALADLCGVLASERVDILALSVESSGHVRFVVDNRVRTEGVLRERRLQVTTRDVLAVSAAHSPGSLARILRLLAEAGVNIEYAYSGVGEGIARATIILGVDNPMRAASAAGL